MLIFGFEEDGIPRLLILMLGIHHHNIFFLIPMMSSATSAAFSYGKNWWVPWFLPNFDMRWSAAIIRFSTLCKIVLPFCQITWIMFQLVFFFFFFIVCRGQPDITIAGLCWLMRNHVVPVQGRVSFRNERRGAYSFPVFFMWFFWVPFIELIVHFSNNIIST